MKREKLRGLLLCAMAALKHLEILSEPSFWAAAPLKSCQFSAYGCLAAKLEVSGRMTAASVGSVVGFEEQSGDMVMTLNDGDLTLEVRRVRGQV